MQIYSKRGLRFISSSFNRDVTGMKGDVVMMDLALEKKGNRDMTHMGDRKDVTGNAYQ